MKKFLNAKNILCLSPHPDDVEYSMSGTINTYPDSNYTTVVMSKGTRSDFTSTEQRFDEVYSFWKGMGLMHCNDIQIAHRPSLHDKSQDQWIVDLERMIEQSDFHPDLIVGPSAQDSHFEHQIVNQIMLALGRKRGVGLVEYKSPSTLHEWTPNLFVSITEETFKLKQESLINSFDTQVVKGAYFDEDSFKLFHQNFTESKKGVKLFEHFRIRNLYV